MGKPQEKLQSTNAFKMAQQQFDNVADMLQLDNDIAEMLRWPTREFKFQVPVKMDDGSKKVFFGYRVHLIGSIGDVTSACTAGLNCGLQH